MLTYAGACRKSLPVKMEICAGSGDWVVAQACKEKGRANWVALELRHDRVYQTMTKMASDPQSSLLLILPL
jgi:tRNA G46 methylase TrmB